MELYYVSNYVPNRRLPAPAEIRTVLDLMHSMQTLRIHGQVVGSIIDALRVEPPKLVNHLVMGTGLGMMNRFDNILRRSEYRPIAAL
jgi:hypothetical protein